MINRGFIQKQLKKLTIVLYGEEEILSEKELEKLEKFLMEFYEESLKQRSV